MLELKKSTNNISIPFVAVQISDHVLGKTGLVEGDLSIYYSKNGVSTTELVAENYTLVERDSTNMPGIYFLTAYTTDMTDTIGSLVLIIKNANIDDVRIACKVKDNTEKDIYDRIGAPVGASMSADLVTVDTVVDSIETKIDGIVTDISNLNNFDPSSDEVDVGKIKGEVISGTNDFKADVSLLATSEELLAVEGKIDTIDNIVDAIKSSTDPLTLVAIADAILSRAISNVEGSAEFRTLAGAIAKLVNKVSVVSDTLTVYKTDDSTTFGTQAVSTDEDADPITGVDTN